ncbi:hypothetical protein SNE40_013695 [Patella caerulea]|uniref:WAP four-disulfide core domain protein 1 n=2 Tax=Patella caerulea TaxID=87958 RepID=A0AAN8JJT9_PATCE
MCNRQSMMYLYSNIVFCILTIPIVVVSRNIVVDNQNDVSEERWLSDGVFYDYMADAPVGLTPSDQFDDKCPPVPVNLLDGACDAVICNSDRECSDESFKCCYNGCTYTCRPKVQPPPFVDWIHEPRRRLSSGRSWLVNGPDTEREVEICSTSPVEIDEDPLMCPHGYYCNIEDFGNPRKGIPNRGHCVKKADDQKLDTIKGDLADTGITDDSDDNIYKQHGCLLDDQLILEQATIQLEGKICHCKFGELVCEDE